MPEPDSCDSAPTTGERVRRLRGRAGLSRTQLAKRSGMSRRSISMVERGQVEPSPDDLAAVAAACGADVAELAPPPAHDLALLGPGASPVATNPVRGEAAFDALLREYLSMVSELRTNVFGSDSLRHGDLSELARALGGTPEAIEARLVALMGTSAQEASELRAAILSSPADAPGAPPPDQEQVPFVPRATSGAPRVDSDHSTWLFDH